MAGANISMGVTGIDKTGAAFNSIRNRAKTTGSQIRSIMSGAIAAAGAYLSVRSIKGAIDEMSHLSDVAQAANVAGRELQQMSTALNILGIQGASIDQLGRAFAMMTKNTGRTGLSGFYETIEELGKIPNLSERSAAAMKVFGRSGLAFIPLANAAKEGTSALQGLVAAMPAAKESSIQAADDIADGWSHLTETFKSLWQDGIMWFVGKITDELPTSFRQAMDVLGAYIDYWMRDIADRLRGGFELIQAYFKMQYAPIGSAAGALLGGGSIKDAWEAAKDGFMTELNIERDSIEDFNRRAEERERKLQDALAKARNFEENYRNAANGAPGVEPAATGDAAKPAQQIADVVRERMARVSNDLIMGGSNAARKLQLLGPEYQSEQKKQTALLKTIADNTKQTAENTDDTAESYTPTDL